LRRERAIDGLHETQIDDAMPTPEEAKKKEAIEIEKTVYKESFDDLRTLKTEIETIQKMLQVGRARLQADFDTWYDQVLKDSRRTVQSSYTHRPSKQVDGDQRRLYERRTDLSAEPKHPLPLTGNQQADDDIRAFYRAKEELHSLQAKRY